VSNKKNTHGGAREGAGAKPKDFVKKSVTIRLYPDDKKRLDSLSEKFGYSQSDIVAYAIKKLKKMPKKL